MNDRFEAELAARFRRLRELERRSAPAFTVSPKRARRPRRTRRAALAAGALAAAAAGFWLAARSEPLATPPESSTLLAWTSPTEALLSPPDRRWLTELPRLHESVLDRFLPSSPQRPPEVTP